MFTHMHKDMSTMFTAATLVVEKNWKSSKCPYIEKYANTLSHSHTTVYYIAFKTSFPYTERKPLATQVLS